jgi:hypothetical protein
MSELEAQLVAVLSSAPGLSAREISARLRQPGSQVRARPRASPAMASPRHSLNSVSRPVQPDRPCN